jgi:phosphoribosylanthranilate isomerase
MSARVAPSVCDAVRVKVCGITLPAQASALGDLGVWALGVVFAARSPRFVTQDRAAEVCAAAPGEMARVGVFVEGSVDEIAATAARCGLTHVQLHRPLDVGALRSATGCAVIEAFAVDGPAALDRARASKADLVLLDAHVPGLDGGTGSTFEWDLLVRSPLERPFVLAGGLTPDNISEAVSRVTPAVVDVSSGVESSPGVKDLDRVVAFVSGVRRAAGAGVS